MRALKILMQCVNVLKKLTLWQLYFPGSENSEYSRFEQCLRKKSPILFFWYHCQMSSTFAIFWQNNTPENKRERYKICNPLHLVL